jgi:hypothetical protein
LTVPGVDHGQFEDESPNQKAQRSCHSGLDPESRTPGDLAKPLDPGLLPARRFVRSPSPFEGPIYFKPPALPEVYDFNNNKIIGTATYAFLVGNSTPGFFPLETDKNKIMSLDITRFEPASGCHIYFDTDAYNNMVVNPRYDPREPYQIACGSVENNRIIGLLRQSHPILHRHR